MYGLPPLPASHYLSAMGILVDKLENKARIVIFLIVTDDPITIYKTWFQRMKQNFNTFMAGSGHVNNRKSVGLDLALLSRCNYTILSYGTFSFWGGFLSEGPKILPVHVLKTPKWKNDRPVKYQEPFLLTDIGLITDR
jgi:hypothetical protein